MQKTILVLMFMVLVSGLAFAQIAAEAVDIPTAQAEIDDLSSQNQKMANENEEYEQSNSSLQNEVEAMEALKRDISVTQGKISSQAGELYTVMQTVNDAEMKSRLNAQISTNRAQRYALEQKTSELNGQIEEHNFSIEKNIRWINRNIIQTKKNNIRIAHLNASIAFTQDEGLGMDEAIEKSQTIQNEVDALINQNPATSAAG
jgi:cell division protein FtsB